MCLKNRTKRRKQDTKNLYRSIGKFIVKFEQICFVIEQNLVFLIHGQGLQNQKVSQILLSGYTAEPLRSLYESLVNELIPLDDSGTDIFKNGLVRFQKLISHRNDIVHSTWLIGAGNKETQDWSETSGMKTHRNKKGAAVKTFKKSANDFDQFADEAAALANLFFRFNASLIARWDMKKNFIVDENGNYFVPKGTEQY